MLYESLYNLLKDISDNIGFDNEFSHGRGSDINVFSKQDKSVLIWLSPIRKTFTFPNQGSRMFSNWAVELAFYMKDQKDANNDQSREILQTTDKVSTKYLIDLQNRLVELDNVFDEVSIQGSQQPFIKVTTHVLTGHLVTFQLNLPDDFHYCP
jgi:hypothetical protein